MKTASSRKFALRRRRFGQLRSSTKFTPDSHRGDCWVATDRLRVGIFIYCINKWNKF